jgi:branched-chain amino acid transport system substrate-binding protein
LINIRALPLALTLVIALSVAACGGTADQRDHERTYPIGLLAPLSGPDSASGQEAVRGAQLAVEVVNDQHAELRIPLADGAGVRHGGRLALAAEDAGALDAVDRMAGKGHALGVMVAAQPEVLRSLAERLGPRGVPLLDVGTTGQLPDGGERRYLRIAPTGQSLVRAAFGLIYQQRARGVPIRRIAVIEAGGARAAAAVTAVREVAAANGNDITSLRYRDQTAEVDPLYQQVLATAADVVFATVSTEAEAAVAVRLGERLRDRTPVLALGPAVELVSGSGAGTALMRVLGWSAEYVARNPVAAAVAERYRSRFGAPMTEAAATSFTATLALADAVDAAPAGTWEGVRSALRRVWFPAAQTIMPWNGVRFDASGQNDLATGLVDQRAPTGFRIVYPAELATATLSWPATKPPGRA